VGATTRVKKSWTSWVLALAAIVFAVPWAVSAGDDERPVQRHYSATPNAPAIESLAQAAGIHPGQPRRQSSIF